MKSKLNQMDSKTASSFASSPTNVVEVWNNTPPRSTTTYVCEESLQKGYSGLVFRGWEIIVDKEGNTKRTPVVFKIFTNKKHFKAERKTLTSVGSHPNIVTMRTEAEESTWNKFSIDITHADVLILDYYKGGDLFEYSKKRFHVYKGVVSLLQFRKISENLLNALNYSLKNGHNHRDLKLENVFLRSEDPTDVVVGDWGLASDTRTGIECCGTLGYMSPESVSLGFNENGYDHELADVWSLGVLLFSLLFNVRPYAEVTERGQRWCQTLRNESGDDGKWETNEFLQALCKQQYKRFWFSHCHNGRGKNVHLDRLWGNDKRYPFMKHVRNFFEVMLAPIKTRATFAELLAHPFLRGDKMSNKKSGLKRARSDRSECFTTINQNAEK